MARNKKSTFSSVISINPYENTYRKTTSNQISKITSPEYSKTQYVISYLNTQSFITAKIQISKNIPNEDLEDAIHNKAYYDLALDQATEYSVKYIETFNTLDDDERHFNVFIIDPSQIKETFAVSAKQIKYIDIIIPSPLLLQTLYTTNAIDSYGVHCFIYFQENDAFICIYNNKEYLYTKSIKYTLTHMHERFCELYGEQITYKDFIKFISTKNLKDTSDDYTEYIIKLYKEIFTNINEILTYIKRAYELEKIDHIYIDSQISTVTKLYEMSEVELNIRSSCFDFNFDLKSNQRYIDHLHGMMQVYTTLESKKRYECNFTLYNRPPRFMKRESGKIIMLIAASLIIGFAYPVAYWALTIMQINKLSSLKEEYGKVHQQKIDRQIRVAKTQRALKKSLDLLKQETLNYSSKKNTLLKIHKIQVAYPMKAKMMAEFTKDLNLHKVYLKGINYDEKNEKKVFHLNLVSIDDKEITNLIKYLTKKYENKYEFSFKEIYYEDQSKKYFSDLQVELL